MARRKPNKVRTATPVADHAPADLSLRPERYETFTAIDERGRQQHAYRTRDRLTDLFRLEVIDKRQLLALEGYRDAHQAAGRGNMRSCLNRTPPGDGPMLSVVIAAGQRIDRLEATIPEQCRYTAQAIALSNRTIEDVAADRSPHTRAALYVMGQRRRASAQLCGRIKGELIEAAECLAIVLRIGSEAA